MCSWSCWPQLFETTLFKQNNEEYEKKRPVCVNVLQCLIQNSRLVLSPEHGGQVSFHDEKKTVK